MVRLWAALASIALAVCASPGAERGQAAARPVTLRLRVDWSAREPGLWSGRLKVDSGRFENPQSLGDAADDAGTIFVDDAGVAIERRSARAGDAFEVSISARPDARLSFELQDASETSPAVRGQISLADCLLKPRPLEAESGAPHVVIHRAPGDALAVSFDRPHLVFAPGETLRLAVALNLLDLREPAARNVKATLKWKLVPAEKNRALADGSMSVAAAVNAANPAEAAIEVKVPDEEGAYNLRLSATGRGFADLERTVQLVVVDPNGLPAVAAAPPKLVDSFDAASGGLLRKVAVILPRSNHESFLSRWLGRRGSRDEPGRDDPSSLTAAAYKLHVAHPGRPHVLELALTAPCDDELLISILTSDGQGKFVPTGVESIVPPLSREPAGNPPKTRLYRQIFWPQDRDSGLCITIEHAGAPVPLGRVELYELGERLPPAQPAATGAVKPREAPAGSHRFVGLYLPEPDIARGLFGPMSHDPAARSNIDDWRTFLVAGRRLAEYLRYQNQTGMMLGVLAGGATIYPSEFARSSLHYDNGRLASTGQDPIDKDVLELLLRIFDSEGLTLVPELHFDSPLESLERLIRTEPELAEEVKLVDRDGRSWNEAAETAGIPGYNVLSPKVQEAVMAIVEELVARYGFHPSFGGIAVALGPSSFLQLPGIEWGYDAATIRRFERASRTRVPRGGDGNSDGDVYQYLTTTARRDWTRFRCAEVARFHHRLVEALTAAHPGARVVFSSRLMPGAASDSEAAAVELVRSGGGPAQSLALQGLDFSQAPYAGGPRVSVLRPIVYDATAGQLAQGALATLSNSPALDTLYRASAPGALLYSQAPRDRAAPLAIVPPAELLPDGDPAATQAARGQPFAHALATLDARMIVAGQAALFLSPADSRPALTDAIARLPDVPFRPAGPQVQPVAVRSARIGNATYLYAVNDSPLPLSLVLSLDCPSGSHCQRLASGQVVPLAASANGTASALRIDLAGYELFECRIARPGVAVVDSQVFFSQAPLAEVRERIDRLSRRMQAASAAARGASKGLRNAGFEESGSRAEPLPGWELGVRSANWSLDADNPRSGQKSLRISGKDGQARLTSPELALNASRFVAVSVWMRSNKSAARVEIALDALVGEEPFRRDELVTVGKSWSQYRFRVDDFPAGEIRQARIFVRPIDSSRLWIDDAEIDAQSLTADELRQLTKTLSSAKLAFEEGRYADCERLLDGYWGRLLLSDPGVPATAAPDRPRMGQRVKGLFRR